MSGIDATLLRRMHIVASTAGAFGACIGSIAIVGWIFDVPTFKSVIPGLATMKMNTALGLLACGVALFIKSRASARSGLDRLAECVALFGAMLGLLNLTEWVGGVNLGIDELLVLDPDTPPEKHPGRMSPATSLCIACAGLAIAALDRLSRTSHVLALISAMVSGLALVAYVYGLQTLARVLPYSSMAAHTATTLFVLSIGQMIARPERSVHRLLVSRTSGGSLARSVLPWIVLLPLTLGFLCLKGQQAGWYGTEFGIAIFAFSSITVLAILVWWNASLLDESDTERIRVASERNESLARERAARSRAEHALLVRDQFMSIVSHELRTPLTPVLLIVSSMQNRSGLPADISQDLHVVRDQIQIETRLIDDLLDLTSLNQGKLMLEPLPMDLNELVSSSATVHQRILQAQKVEVSLDLAAAPARVLGDVWRLRQVLWNLIGNAAKFMPGGGQIRIRTYNDGGEHVCLEVTDSGVGIAPEALDRIFGAFQQEDATTTRRFGGLGIGLTICRMLVELHHGTIRATSDGQGHGATFLVRLPLCLDPIPPNDRPTAPARRSSAVGRKLDILVVEDNRESLRAMERLLRGLGHGVVAAESATPALNAAKDRRFDLLISDIGLPDLDGWELMRLLRQQSKDAMRGIALSGFAGQEDHRRSLDAGYTCHLVKPIELGSLVRAIDSVFDESA